MAHYCRPGRRVRRQYSATRLFAFRDYCDSTPRVRIVLVPALFCAPAALVLVAFDATPLQDPSDGWRANSAFWMRIGVGSALVASFILLSVSLLIPAIRFSWRQVAAIAVLTSGGYTASLMLIAELWRFPVPFTFAVGGAPMMAVLGVLVVYTLGTADKARLVKYFKYTNALSLYPVMMVIYPIYSAVFAKLEGGAQLGLVLLLPWIKYAFKRALVKLYPVEDDLYIAVRSSVDIFDALYMTKCMQSRTSLTVGLGIIAVDAAQNAVAIWRLEAHSRALLRVQAESRAQHWDVGHLSSAGLIPWVLRVVSKAKRFDALTFRPDASFTLSADSKRMLRYMQARSRPATDAETPRRAGDALSLVAVAPTPQDADSGVSGCDQVGKACELALTEATRLLHLSESVAVAEYIETVVPLLYAVCVSIVFHLPNAKYYRDMEGMTDEKLRGAVHNILIYALMEFLSMVVVHAVLQRRFGVSVFYQLAFALESEWALIQSGFLTWILVIFQFLLVHNGVDFHFIPGT
ncbi:hypothetical protein PybrP1_004947 [[Pythium] brassicae (nom. inval.)]|nr:hypothetical protein PybrP1_004947 [[Pythium] brassicae (nom. inval.)]